MFKLKLILLALFTLTFTPALQAHAQVAMDASGMGLIIPGYDSRACDTAIEGAIRYNSSANSIQICQPSAESTPANCANIGEVCGDGSIYAGTSPDGDVPMYTTPANAPGTYAWTATTYVNRGLTSTVTGEANTAALVTPNNHPAAQYCANLVAHTRDDWYLPSSEEIWVLETNSNTGALSGTLNANVHYTSSEVSQFVARMLDNFGPTPNIGTASKGNSYNVRCVRKFSTALNWTDWGD
jgi:hypothetical protein